MPDSARETANGRRVWVDLTEAEHAALEQIAREQEQEVEVTASELVSTAIAGQVRRATGQTGLSASVVKFHRARQTRDEESGR